MAIRAFLSLAFTMLMGVAQAAPVIELGTPSNECVTYCYIRVPFTISGYDSSHRVGRIFCDFDAEVSASLPVYGGETRKKDVQASNIGVFKNDAGKVSGDVEMSTGILKKYFVDAKLKKIQCHL